MWAQKAPARFCLCRQSGQAAARPLMGDSCPTHRAGLDGPTLTGTLASHPHLDRKVSEDMDLALPSVHRGPEQPLHKVVTPGICRSNTGWSMSRSLYSWGELTRGLCLLGVGMGFNVRSRIQNMKQLVVGRT